MSTEGKLTLLQIVDNLNAARHLLSALDAAIDGVEYATRQHGNGLASLVDLIVDRFDAVSEQLEHFRQSAAP